MTVKAPLRTKHYVMTTGPHWVRLERTPVPFASLEEIVSLGDEVNSELRAAAGPGVKMLLDFRHGPPGRNDPAFEAAVERSRAMLSSLFEHVGVLVGSAAGRLQVQRISRSHGRPTEVFVDDAEAKRWLESK